MVIIDDSFDLDDLEKNQIENKPTHCLFRGCNFQSKKRKNLKNHIKRCHNAKPTVSSSVKDNENLSQTFLKTELGEELEGNYTETLENKKPQNKKAVEC